MYSAELEKHKKEKEEWRRKALKLEDQVSAFKVDQLTNHMDHMGHLFMSCLTCVFLLLR